MLSIGVPSGDGFIALKTTSLLTYFRFHIHGRGHISLQPLFYPQIRIPALQWGQNTPPFSASVFQCRF